MGHDRKEYIDKYMTAPNLNTMKQASLTPTLETYRRISLLL